MCGTFLTEIIERRKYVLISTLLQLEVVPVSVYFMIMAEVVELFYYCGIGSIVDFSVSIFSINKNSLQGFYLEVSETFHYSMMISTRI